MTHRKEIIPGRTWRTAASRINFTGWMPFLLTYTVRAKLITIT